MKTETVKSFELPEMRCPYCARMHELHTGLGSEAPKAGDVGVCWGCKEVAIFTEGAQSLRKPTTEEAAVFAKDVKLRQAQYAAAISPTPNAAARRMRPQ